LSTLCSIENIFRDAEGKFQVFFVKTNGDQIQTQVLAPLNEFGTVDFSLKNPAVFLNGAELVYNSDYTLTAWEDPEDGKKKVQVNAMGNTTFKQDDYILVWMQIKLDPNDIQFTSEQRIWVAKLNQIFKAVIDKLNELKSAGYVFASNAMYQNLAEGIKVLLADYTEMLENQLNEHTNSLTNQLDDYVAEVNKPQLFKYVENTLKPDITQFFNLANYIFEDFEDFWYVDGGDMNYPDPFKKTSITFDFGDIDTGIINTPADIVGLDLNDYSNIDFWYVDGGDINAGYMPGDVLINFDFGDLDVGVSSAPANIIGVDFNS